MHTELLECLLDEVRAAVLKLDRIACALEEIDYAAQFTRNPTRHMLEDKYGYYFDEKADPPLTASQLDRGRAE